MSATIFPFLYGDVPTAGLKRPPVTRKNAQTLTVKANPKQSDEYSKLEVFGGAPGAGFGVLDTCVPAKEKKRNRKVPTNSPITQSKLCRSLSGSRSMGSWPPPFPPALGVAPSVEASDDWRFLNSIARSEGAGIERTN